MTHIVWLEQKLSRVYIFFIHVIILDLARLHQAESQKEKDDLIEELQEKVHRP